MAVYNFITNLPFANVGDYVLLVDDADGFCEEVKVVGIDNFGRTEVESAYPGAETVFNYKGRVDIDPTMTCRLVRLS